MLRSLKLCSEGITQNVMSVLVASASETAIERRGSRRPSSIDNGFDRRRLMLDPYIPKLFDLACLNARSAGSSITNVSDTSATFSSPPPKTVGFQSPEREQEHRARGTHRLP